MHVSFLIHGGGGGIRCGIPPRLDDYYWLQEESTTLVLLFVPYSIDVIKDKAILYIQRQFFFN